MNEIRHQTNTSGQYPARGNYQTDYPARHDTHWSPAKKYLVFGGATLAVIAGALFLLAFKIALVLTGLVLGAAALLGGYIYLRRKF